MERASRYDALVATFVGVTALLVSAYTAYIQRQQVRAQVFPIVSLATGWSDTEVHIEAANKGSGPARIRDMHITVAGQSMHNWIDLVNRAAAGRHGVHNFHYSSMGHTTIAAGEHDRVFELSCPTTPVKNGDPARLTMDPNDSICGTVIKMFKDMTISICYCSTLEDCSLFEDGPNRDSSTTDVRGCPKRTDSSFE